MKKKFLSLFIIGCLFAGMGLSAECLAAPHHRDIKNNQHKELRHKPAHKKSVKKAPAKKHQAIKKHQQSKFKAQKQHQKNVKKFNKNQQKINKKQNNKHSFHKKYSRHNNKSRNHRK